MTIEFGGSSCFVIAEVGLTHDGSVGLAHAFIDAIAETGADGVKFQTHIAAAESTPSEPFRVNFSHQDRTRYDYWRRMEFSQKQWQGLREHAEEKGLVFLSSPFSIEAVELLDSIDMELWKIPSGEVGNTSMLDRVAATGRPVILSSGMSPLSELDLAVERIRGTNAPVAVLQCTTAYPCPPEKIGINLLEEFRQRYQCPVGLSDHSGTIFSGLAASALGADILELHVTLSRDMFGPDVVASVTIPELRQLVGGIRFVERMRANPVDKDLVADDLTSLRNLFTKSVVVRTALDAGTVLGDEHLLGKKPGTGIPATRLKEFIGRRLRRSIEADTLLAESDLEKVPKP
tara:strand:- start:2454 stop:3491 length:1038 start_codon:yes stop_codon:yes gene_type:complete